MFGFSHFLLSFYILGSLLDSSKAWRVDMPQRITALLNSCVVIPCSFDYSANPPYNPFRVVWYQYKKWPEQFPLVYDIWNPYEVIHMFRGKTSLYHQYFKTCSLRIYPVTEYHHSEKIYPWVDPENIGRYTHKFWEETVTIDVKTRPDEPEITISGDRRVGRTVEVKCRVWYTCPSDPPTLTLNLPVQSNSVSDSCRSDGVCIYTLTSQLHIKSDRQTVTCSVRHKGGPTASASVNLYAECSRSYLTISPTSMEFLEGQASKVTCNASYTCSKDEPVLTWNYDKMPASSYTREISSAHWSTVSTLKFTASAKDNGRSLICYARFRTGQTQENSITLRVKRSMLSLGWSFTTPGRLTGMLGSCIIVPCSFTYSKPQLADLRVIWYLYRSKEFPPVYDEKQGAISTFNGKTSLTGSVGELNCSLKIEKIEMTHNGNRIYPWIDEHPITAYHVPGNNLLDKTTELIVTNQAQEPQLGTIGIPRVGEQGRVSCSVHHTCITSPPMLVINGITGEDIVINSLESDGIWQRTIERTWMVKETDQSLTCTVSYSGGQKATRELKLSVECPYKDIEMIVPPSKITEGVAMNVICSVTYKCKTNKPNIVWNYENMLNVPSEREMPGNTYSMESNLTFIGSLDDNGKPLTCTAQFVTGNISATKNLQIKKYELYEQMDFKESREIPSRVVNVPLKIGALTRSCVVIPCSFEQQDEIFTRGIWSKRNGDIIYHNGRSLILNHFKDRSRMLGDLNEGNCSLEIEDIKPFDNGPFCFHVQKENINHRFNNSCVFIVMKASPDKPVMTPVLAEVDAGSVVRVSCSVMHTCPSHSPELSWSVQNLTSEVTHSATAGGVWTTTSSITFMVAAEDKSLTCTANFWQGKQSSSTVELVVKGLLMYRLKSSLPAAIPVSLVVLIALAAVCGVSANRKRKHTNTLLAPPPPRPEKRRSLWDRLSRRYHKDRERPPRPEKRRSTWARFSRGQDGRLGWSSENQSRYRESFWNRFSGHQGDAANFSVAFQNNTDSVSYNNKISKPRYPSQQNARKNPYRPEDYQVYANN